jgi:hypothetical protein
MDANENSRHQKSFCRRICALIDHPYTHNHTAVSETAEERLIVLLQWVPHPRIPLASDEFRLMRFEPTGRDGATSVSLVNKSLDEIGDDYIAVSYC